MIHDEETAKTISDLMVELGAKLDESVKTVKERCSAEEFETYRQAIGKIMGYMLFDVMNPLYKEHPQLKPKGLD